MKIAGLANEHGRKRLEAKAAGGGVQIAWVDSVEALSEHPDAIAYFDLSFEMNGRRIEQLRRLLPKPVIINSVVHTLEQIGQPFIRINAWPGFLEREICEIAFLRRPGVKMQYEGGAREVGTDDAGAREEERHEDRKHEGGKHEAGKIEGDKHREEKSEKDKVGKERFEDEEKIAAVFEGLHWQYRIVPDIPGMIGARMIAAIVNEACYTLQDEVGTKESIDTAMRLGTHYPQGPFEWASLTGLQNIHSLLAVLEITDPCYKMSDLLRTSAGYSD